jgi:hypothetical protein
MRDLDSIDGAYIKTLTQTHLIEDCGGPAQFAGLDFTSEWVERLAGVGGARIDIWTHLASLT